MSQIELSKILLKGNKKQKFPLKIVNQKKVLLRERKRHTARRVTSTRCAVPSGRWGYIPADVNRHTPVKTVPSLVLRTRAVKQLQWVDYNLEQKFS